MSLGQIYWVWFSFLQQTFKRPGGTGALVTPYHASFWTAFLWLFPCSLWIQAVFQFSALSIWHFQKCFTWNTVWECYSQEQQGAGVTPSIWRKARLITFSSDVQKSILLSSLVNTSTVLHSHVSSPVSLSGSFSCQTKHIFAKGRDFVEIAKTILESCTMTRMMT